VAAYDDPAARPLGLLLELIRCEIDGSGGSRSRPGADAAQAGLAQLVLVQALRAHLATLQQPPGWLGGIGDPRIGKALACLHGEPARAWTVEALARAAGMSRTAFANRFRRLAGTTPLDYLSEWRMTMARRALASGDESIADIAARVGYRSDTAFNAAFKRAHGQSPGRFRSQGRAAAAR